MIARYNDIYCCVDASITPMEIWVYHPIDGFNRNTTNRGTIFYNKFVYKSEIDELFDVGFSAQWNGEWCGASYMPKTGRIRLITNNYGFAQKNNMEELDRGVWETYVNVQECQQYRMTVWTYGENKTENTTILTLAEWEKNWHTFKTELNPPRS